MLCPTVVVRDASGALMQVNAAEFEAGQWPGWERVGETPPPVSPTVPAIDMVLPDVEMPQENGAPEDDAPKKRGRPKKEA